MLKDKKGYHGRNPHTPGGYYSSVWTKRRRNKLPLWKITRHSFFLLMFVVRKLIFYLERASTKVYMTNSNLLRSNTWRYFFIWVKNRWRLLVHEGKEGKAKAELYTMFICNGLLRRLFCFVFFTAWDGPQPDFSGRPGPAVPTRSARERHPTAAALCTGCALSRTNVLFSLQSFLILLLTVWQDYLILLGWPFRDFVLNLFFFFF